MRAQTVARWERGLATPLARHRRPLAETLAVSLAELEYFLDGIADPGGSAAHHLVPPWLDHYSTLEQSAAKLETFEPIVVPGLLQTEDYATAVMRSSHLPIDAETVKARVQARLSRQAVLRRTPVPLEVRCVIDESVLHRVTGGPETMAEQLDHLVSLAASETVDVRIVPMSSGGLHCAAFGSFRLFTSPDATGPYIACTEDLTGFNYLDRRHAIDAHAQLFRHLVDLALEPDQSGELLTSMAADYR